MKRNNLFKLFVILLIVLFLGTSCMSAEIGALFEPPLGYLLLGGAALGVSYLIDLIDGPNDTNPPVSSPEEKKTDKTSTVANATTSKKENNDAKASTVTNVESSVKVPAEEKVVKAELYIYSFAVDNYTSGIFNDSPEFNMEKKTFDSTVSKERINILGYEISEEDYHSLIFTETMNGEFGLSELNSVSNNEIPSAWFSVHLPKDDLQFYSSWILDGTGKSIQALGKINSLNGKMATDLKEEITLNVYSSVGIGSRGPAGGYIFYDVDADNANGNKDGLVSSECGWRFLEAAPADITVNGESRFVFGNYRKTADGSNLYVNGTTSYNKFNCTGTAIGTGKRNTELLVSAMGSNAYSLSSGTSTTANYAAKLCNDYSYGGFDDWFLPSMDELDLMYTNLKRNGLGSFANVVYWSSSESRGDSACYQSFSGGTQNGSYHYRSYNYNVRAVRAF